jgi:hypothetical protein
VVQTLVFKAKRCGAKRSGEDYAYEQGGQIKIKIRIKSKIRSRREEGERCWGKKENLEMKLPVQYFCPPFFCLRSDLVNLRRVANLVLKAKRCGAKRSGEDYALRAGGGGVGLRLRLRLGLGAGAGAGGEGGRR